MDLFTLNFSEPLNSKVRGAPCIDSSSDLSDHYLMLSLN
ncbi:MAG: hypothetical protein OFPII_40990 [Osedax symbiont Rs1]|nr:MAG: hypothetical protein OFPII_40990 [Osedax symbiont Rs1]